jgi:MFS family permease
VTVGRLCDIYGRVKVYNLGLAVLMAGSVALFLGGGGMRLILWRVGLGDHGSINVFVVVILISLVGAVALHFRGARYVSIEQDPNTPSGGSAAAPIHGPKSRCGHLAIPAETS